MLKCGDLTPAEFLELLALAPVHGDEPVRLWHEGPDRWALDYWRGLDAEVRCYSAGNNSAMVKANDLMPKTQAGRLFAPSGELRWRRLPMLGDREYRVVFLGDHDWFADRLNDKSGELPRHRSKSEIILWGQRTKAPEWLELRIPHRLLYPVDDPQQKSGRVGVKAHIETWKDDCGEPHFVRLCDLESYSVQ